MRSFCDAKVAIFATTEPGIQGVMIQMFNHGINIIGLWIVVNLIERQFHTRKISELGGLAQKASAPANCQKAPAYLMLK